MSRSRNQSLQAGNVNNNNNRNNNRNGNANGNANGNGNGAVTCHKCHKQGHSAANCRSDPANQNRRNGVQQPVGGPKDDCYIHKGKGHTNETCTSPVNTMGMKAKQPKPVQTQTADQTLKVDRRQYASKSQTPYCGRCNKVDHELASCINLPVSEQCVLVCQLCQLPGHSRNQCNNPNFCLNCSKAGHSVANCKEAKNWMVRFAEHRVENIPNPYQDVSWHKIVGSSHITQQMVEHMTVAGGPLKNQRQLYYETNVVGKGWNPYRCDYDIGLPAPAKNEFAKFGAGVVSHGDIHKMVAPAVFNCKNAKTKAYIAPGFVNMVDGVPQDTRLQHLLQLEAEANQKRRCALAEKVFRSKQMYSLANVNAGILAGEKAIEEIVKSFRDGRKLVSAYSQEALEILEHLHDNHSFTRAALLVEKKGWTYFRDPSLMEAIARKNRAVCHKCETGAYYFDAKFEVITVDTDVMSLTDSSDWGVMLAFPCKCCAEKGYTFVSSVDEIDLD